MFDELALHILKKAVDILGIIVLRQDPATDRMIPIEEPSTENVPVATEHAARRLMTHTRLLGLKKKGKAIEVEPKKPGRPKAQKETKAAPEDLHRHKQCVRCGMTKGVSGFLAGSLTCRTCQRLQTEGGR